MKQTIVEEKTSQEVNFTEIINLIEFRKKNAYQKVNEELILLNWDFGKYVSEKLNNNKWGSKVVEELANFIQDKYPSLKGFNRAGIYRMKQFYETYKNEFEIVSTLLRQLNWSSHILILSSTDTMEEKIFYMKLAIQERYSTRELARQIDSNYYLRYQISKNAGKNEKILINEEEYPNTRFLDSYSLEFLNLPRNYDEKDLRKAIIGNLKDFILEIGKSFTFVGEEYRIQVGNEDFYIDLLFYNRELSCLVAFELKIGKFKPEYVSKMDFYLEALDRQIKQNNENPSVGIILCTDKNDDIVEYSLSRTMSPTLVSEYKLKLINKELLENRIKEIKNNIFKEE